MMTCHDVSTLVSAGVLSDAPFMQRLSVRMHLLLCRHCRAFAQQFAAIARAAQSAAEAFSAEAPHDFESRVVQRIRDKDAQWGVRT